MPTSLSVPVWQIVIMVICSLAGLVSMLSQFIIAGMIRRLNRHSDKLEDHQDRIVSLENNHENGNKTTGNVERDLTEIKKKLDEFILQYYKDKAEQNAK
jgi:hypothetical protein